MNQPLLPEMEMFTHQGIFDLVASKLIEQGRPSGFGNTCRYRSNNGCKCAAGHLIPDDRYNPSLEGTRVGISPAGYARMNDGWDEAALSRMRQTVPGAATGMLDPRISRHIDTMLLVWRLQKAHDRATVNDFREVITDIDANAVWLKAWVKLMREIANEFSLDDAILETAE